MSLFSVLKINSKKALSNNWAKAIGVSFIPIILAAFLHSLTMWLSRVILPGESLFTFSPLSDTNNIIQHMLSISVNIPMLILGSSICIMFLLITFFVITPLFLGVSHWNFNLVQGKTKGIGSLFHYFESGKNYRRALGLDISLTLRKAFWSILIFTIPYALNHFLRTAGLYYASALTQPSYQILYWVGRVLIWLVTIALWLGYSIIINKYFLGEYFLSQDDILKSGKAIKKSIEYTKGYRSNIFKYKLSFIGLAFLCLFIAPAFYVIPYYNSATAMYALYLKETVNREKPVLEAAPPTDIEEIKPEIVNQLAENINYNPANNIEAKPTPQEGSSFSPPQNER